MTEDEKQKAIGEVLFGKDEHEKQMGRVALQEECDFIEKFAQKWNYKLMKYLPRFKGCGVLVGWIHLEEMFRVFLRAYNWRK